VRRKIVFSLAAFFLILGLVAFGYKQMSASGNAGYVIIGIGDWVLETSLYFVIIFLTLLFLALYFGIRFMTGAAKLPDSIKKRNSEQRSKRSLEALVAGLIETIEGKWEKAERTLIRHAGDSSLPLFNYLTAARAAHARGANEQRDDYLKLAQKSAPEAELAVNLSRVKLLMGSHQYQEALDQLTEINRAHANHPVVLRMMGDAYIQTRDWDALHHLIPMLREGKLMPEGELRKLEIEAYRTLLEKRALTRDPMRIREIWRMVPANVRTELAVVLPYCKGMIDAGMGEEVEEDLRLALGRDWDPELLRLYSGIEMADPSRQLLGAEDWLGPHRDDAQLLHVLGRFALRAGQTEKATQYLQRSLTLEPTMEACKLLGDLLYDRKEDVAAGVLYRQGLKLAAREPADSAALSKVVAIVLPPADSETAMPA